MVAAWKGNMRISLTALRAFEATARLGSMSQASAELRVGLASISRHISALQTRLKVELLAREGRRVVLTPAGRAYFEEISTAFARITAATERASWRGAGRGPRLVVAAEPCLAQRWLMPRLATFRASVPGLSLELLAAASDASAEAALQPDVSVTFRWSLDRLEPGAVVLAEPRIIALAASQAPPPSSLAALVRGATLVHQRSPEPWQRWLALAGHNGEPPRAGVVVPDKAWALSAAASGLGVALACTQLAQGEIAAGRCRPVLGEGFQIGGYVATPAARPVADSALIERFTGWLGQALRQAA